MAPCLSVAPVLDLAVSAPAAPFRRLGHLTSFAVHTLVLCAAWHLAWATPTTSDRGVQTTAERSRLVWVSDRPRPRLEEKGHVLSTRLPLRKVPAPPPEVARPLRQGGAEIGAVRTGVFPVGPLIPQRPTALGVVRTGVLGNSDSGPASGGNTIGSVVIGTLDGPVASPAPPNPPAAIQPSFPHGGPVLEPVALPADIEPARLLSPVIPEYPYDARRAAASGIVRLEVRLKRSGEVEFLRVIEGPGHGLNEAARDAVKRTRCSPARRKGEPIDVTATVRVVFRLA